MMFGMVFAAAAALAVAIFLVAVAATFAFVVFAFVTPAAAVVFKRLEVFVCRFAYRDNFDSKVEIFTGEFVVSIDNGSLFCDGLDADGHRAGRSLGIERHAGFDFFNALEHIQRNFLCHFFIVFAVAFSRDDNNVKLVAHVMTDHSLFEPRNNHVHALDILERFATLGGIDNGTFIGLQGVVHLDDCFFSNFHKYPLESQETPAVEP